MNFTKVPGFASCLRVVDPVSFETVNIMEFENGEAVFSIFTSAKVGQPGYAYLFLGIGEHANLERQCTFASINTYILGSNGIDM